jgi:hypothetical protein
LIIAKARSGSRHGDVWVIILNYALMVVISTRLAGGHVSP